MTDKERCECCGSWEAECASDKPVPGCRCSRCASHAIDKALFILHNKDDMPSGWVIDTAIKKLEGTG